MVFPYATADLTVSASIDAYVIAAGVAAEVALLDLGWPVTLESCVFGDCKNQCINTQIATAAGGGRVYVFIKTIWSGRDEWDVFNWDGASWSWPQQKDGEYTGICTTGDIKTTPP